MALASYDTKLVINRILRLTFILAVICVICVRNYRNDKIKTFYFAILVPIFAVVKRYLRWILRIQCS